MTLVSSGTLHLIGSAVAPTRSIVYECTGFYTAYNLLAARAVAGFSLPVSMQDFYGYSGCALPVPGVPSSVSGVDSGFFATCTYGTGTNATNYRIQYAISPWTVWNPSAGGGAYDVASPYTTTLSNGSWKFRVASENCAGMSAYRTSAAFTMS